MKTASCRVHGRGEANLRQSHYRACLSHLSNCSAEHQGRGPKTRTERTSLSQEGSDKTFLSGLPDDESVAKVDWKSPGKRRARRGDPGVGTASDHRGSRAQGPGENKGTVTPT